MKPKDQSQDRGGDPGDPVKPTAMEMLRQDHQERVQRAGQAIAEACQRERVILHVPGFKIINGAVEGQIQIVPVD